MMKRLILALLVVLAGLASGCTDDNGDASTAPVLEDGNQVPGEQ